MARFTETSNIQKVDTSTGFAAASNSLLNRLNQFSSQAETVARGKAAERGVDEARQVELRKKDGLTQMPEEREQSIGERILTGNITQKAYNKTLKTAYLASIGNDVMEGIKRIEAENPSDIVTFNEKAQGYTNGALSGADPEAQPELKAFIDGQMANARVRVHGNTIKRNKAEAAAETTAAIQSFANESASLSREGNDIGAAESIVQASYLIDSMVDSGDLPADRAAIMKREIEREASEQSKRASFDGILAEKGADAAQAELDKIRAKAPKGWTPDEWKTYTNSQQADINRQKAKQGARRTEINKEARTALKQYETAVSLGFEVSAEETVRVKGLVSDSPEMQDQFDRINKTSAFSVLSNDDRQAKINEAETGKLEDVQDFAAIIQANNTINKLATEDGYSLGVKQGIVEPVEFDMSNPATLVARAEKADILSNHYGVPVSPLSDAEADSLSASIEGMTVPEKVVLATTLNEAPAVWGQISPKNQQAFSMAGATGDRVLMATVFSGQELLKNKLVTPAKSSDYLPVSDEYLSDVYGTQDKAAILEAAKAHYASTAGNVDVFDEDAFETSLGAVTGGIGEVNGGKVELPRGVGEDAFEDFVDSFTPSQVGKLGGVTGFTDEQAALAIQNGKIKSIGANKYIVMTGDSQALFTKKGEPLTIEFTPEAQAEQQAANFAKRIQLRERKLRKEFEQYIAPKM